ncbi:hypothetical protein [Streptomyces sp. NPDC002133]|uniref:hypothetical protein n=1 Tax=Streptomyces sp. NPDC002133 TaxID=3154409 RepID=UPI003323B5D7
MTDPAPDPTDPLRLLREHPRLAQLAAFPFDFDLRRAEHGEAVRLASGASPEPMAGDDSGGTYFLCGGPDRSDRPNGPDRTDGPVLYASSEGQAGLIGATVTEALEILIGLPGWYDYVALAPDAGEERILAAVAEQEDGIRESYAPDLDAQRIELRTALGLPERSPVELLGMLHAALLRTEPEHVLLNADEGLAYALLDPHPRTPLRDIVLAPGRADLAAMRAAGDRGTWDDVAADAVRRATVLRAAQFDRRDADLPVLRYLLEREAADTGHSDELRLAAVLVGRHGPAEDAALLRGGPLWLPEEPEARAARARELDAERYGQDPSAAAELTWVTLARRQGRTELARVGLIRLLDDTGPDAQLLSGIAQELALLGDFTQAARAQYNVVSLQDTAWHRASAGLVLAAYERSAAGLTGALRALERVVAALEPAPASASDQNPDQLQLDLGLEPPAARERDAVPDWRRRRRFGGRVTEEYLLLALSAAEAAAEPGSDATSAASGDGAGSDAASVAREAMSHGRTLLREIAEPSRKALGPLAQKAKWAVARLPR